MLKTSGKNTYTFEAMVEFTVNADDEWEAREKIVNEHWEYWLLDDTNSPGVLDALTLLSTRINTDD